MPPTPPETTGPIAFLARQAGTAAAFTPLIDALEASGDTPLVMALGDAQRSWGARASLSHAAFSGLEGELAAQALPSLLITGTSAEVDDDARSWRWARQAGVPTVAFVDSWVNYAMRFTASHGGWVDPLPDVIAVIDEASRERMRRLGLPDGRLRVLGSPAFDALMSQRSPSPSQDGGVELLFASQPLAGRGLAASWNEHAALDLLIDTLKSMVFELPVTLVLRRHPAEPEGLFSPRLEGAQSPDLRLRIDDRPDRIASVAAAHVVVSVVSMLQVEAQWLGRPALSIQPGDPAPADLLDLHHVPVATDKVTVKAALERLLSERWSAPSSPPLATPQWLDFISQMCRYDRRE
ncbi:MAG: hypothetical protein ACPGU1_04470 [Myxococcota bacterium]